MNTPEVRLVRKSRSNGLVLLFNFGLIAATLICYLCNYISPKDIGYLVLLGLGYPVIVLLHFVFLLYWFFKKKRLMWWSGLTLLLGLAHLTDVVQINFTKTLKEGEKELKVLTWNVHLFGLYNWENNVKTRNAMFDVLKAEQADVLCFQEFYHSDERGLFPTRDTLITFLPTTYYHQRYTHSPRHNQYFGVIIFSRYPIVGRGDIPFQGDANNYCIYADLKIGSDTVRVYNAHLQSIRFGKDDYAFVQENQKKEDIKQGAFRIMRKLRRAFVRREDQVEKVVQHITSCPHKVILCGDFNDPPHSYTYERFSDVLRDSFLDAGNGLGNTFNHPAFPPLRIDYILHSEGMRAHEYTTLREDLSDHFPVVAQIAW